MSNKIDRWRAEVEGNDCRVENITPLEEVTKSNGELLFAMLDTKVLGADDHRLPGIVVLRGDFVATLIHISITDSSQKYFLMVGQRRIANGQIFWEHPAGMMDEDIDPLEVALKEVREETGLELEADDLILLNEDKVYSSPGLLDEGGFFFACELEMTEQEARNLERSGLSAEGENENITTKLMTRGEVRRSCRNANGLLHLFLYEEQLKK